MPRSVISPRLYVVALSHLDTQWRWTVRDTVERYLPATVEENERLFTRFPAYVLSFEGSWRYRLLAEHHPELFAIVRRRVAEDRWCPAGAAVEAFDTLLPSPESIARQLLYGRRWFRRELGRDSRDLFLPDCFGFPVTLPTLAAHFDLIGFSTQKLRRGAVMRSAFGIPFPFGRWRGADGGEILAALDPGEYSGGIEGDLTRDEERLAEAKRTADAGVPPIDLLYVGIGDRGGAIPEATAERLSAALAADGPLAVRHGASDRVYGETTPEERAALPVHSGELLLHLHGTGCYTAKAALKLWNRRLEGRARIAEAAALAALAAGHPPPRRRLEEAWQLLLAHQMHDDLTGTAIPAAYEFTFADFGLAANELEEIALDAVDHALDSLDTSGEEPQLVALSTVAVAQRELVEVTDLPPSVDAVVDASGTERPIQRLAAVAGASRALVPVDCRGVELQLLRLRRRRSTVTASGHPVAGGADWLESDRYRLELDGAGALQSLFDKRLARELLAGPATLDLLPDRSAKYPAWEILWRDASSPPYARVDRLLEIEPTESGPLRAALRVRRQAAGVEVSETWSLAAGEAGELAAIEVEIDWRRRASLLKATWRLSAANPVATYDTGLGAIERPLASESLYEVPAQQWAAIEDARDGFAVALFADCRHGWDHPEPGILRSTWIHAPRASLKWRHQATQDFGRHRLRFALAGLNVGDLAGGRAHQLADRFLHRPRLFRVLQAGAGGGPRRRSLVQLQPPSRLLALKPAEDADAAVLRVSNPSRQAHPLSVASDLPRLAEIRTANGMEEVRTDATAGASAPVAAPSVPSQGLATLLSSSLAPDGFRQLEKATYLTLPWKRRGACANGERAGGGGFDDQGRFFPIELLPEALQETAAPFSLGHLRARRGDFLVAEGQRIELPDPCAEVWWLAASVGGEIEVEFVAGERRVAVHVPDWRSPLLRDGRLRFGPLGLRREPGRFRRAPTAWACGHLHDRRGRDLAVERGTLFALRTPTYGAPHLLLPRQRELRIVAATAVPRPARRIADAEPPLEA